VLSLLVMLVLSAVQTDAGHVVHFSGACKDGVVRGPSGPFAVWVFCENALGTHIGVVYADHMESPKSGAWSITDRFWQQQVWAADVESVAWSEDGGRLFVSIGAVYGSSALYQLDLLDRKAYKLIVEAPDRSVEIIAVSPSRIRCRVTNAETGLTREGRARVRVAKRK
jgi:hypothetical protein